MGENWDTETADRCRLPELIPDICRRCRDYDYCHRQLSLFETEGKDGKDIPE